ncbi:mobilization protein MobS [Staphylococcus aureus]|uniref:mobilization protein MobS n=1 Tax=Staphylococcus aureus TaxID=1280 RepID=UPI0012B26848|nr:mobilization protein MobS [Staphylococcus aureus]MST17609.1 mobilization protein MobS [Staphylococcus aureus]
MSLLGSSDLKEQKKINDLELKINREKQKLNKKITRQKILLGTFMIELLEKNQVEGLGQYTADNLGAFLSRQGDKELMKELINSLRDLREKG